MNPSKIMIVRQWILTLLGTALIVMGSISFLLLFYGGGSWQTAARLEATRLSTIEMSELIGTPNYQQDSQVTNYTLWYALASSVHLPFTQPDEMLLRQLPETTSPTPDLEDVENGQSGLFQTLSVWESTSKKINLGWIPKYSGQNAIEMMQQSPGINVICPNWLTVKSGNGSVSQSIQSNVVSYAHKHNIQVWAMFDNQFSPSLTHLVLSNAGARRKMISQVVSSAKRNHLDGINVDFENMQTKDETNFTKMIEEMHEELAGTNVKLSVDITKDIAFLKDNAAYFHAALAANSDYVILMAYDEHWSSDPVPGPVADVPWVTNGVDDLLDTGVPANKIILGIPLYARFWHVYPDGHVTSEAIADANVGSVLSSHHATISWNDKLGVAYARYSKQSGYEEGWYETGQTLNRKLSLVNDDGLAGTALWSLNLSSEQTWHNVMDSLRESLS